MPDLTSLEEYRKKHPLPPWWERMFGTGSRSPDALMKYEPKSGTGMTEMPSWLKGIKNWYAGYEKYPVAKVASDSPDYLPTPYVSPEQQATQQAVTDFNNPNSIQNLEGRLAATGYDMTNDPQGLLNLLYKGDPNVAGIIDTYWQSYQRQQKTNITAQQEQLDKETANWTKQAGDRQQQAFASNAAQNVSIQNEVLRNAMAEAATQGVDTSWVTPKLQQLTYDYQVGSTIYPTQQGDPETIVANQLIQQVNQAKGAEDYMMSQRLASQYPMIAQRFQDIVAQETEKTLSSKQWQGGVEAGYAGTPSFATFLKTNQPMTNDIQVQEKQNITKYPEMYPKYLQAGTPKSFMDWVNESPLKQATFDSLYGAKSITPRESSIPRWATAKVRF